MRTPVCSLVYLILHASVALAATNPLIDAINKGATDQVRALLDQGVNPNDADDSEIGGWTPLMAAARVGSVSISQMLLASHANINAVNERGDTALDVATANRHFEVASILEKAGGVDRSVRPAAGLKNPSTAFSRALLRVLEAADEEFRPIVGGRDAHLYDDDMGTNPKYYSRVVLPGFRCSIYDADDNWYKRRKGQGPSEFFFGCELISGDWTPAMERSYQALVEKVGLATGWPRQTMDGGFAKTETRPGSKVFKEDRSTVFVKNGAYLAAGVTYVEVQLNGSFGLNGHWVIQLTVGKHFPQ
jgi:hypothetical protein